MTKSIRVDAEAEEEIMHAIDRYECGPVIRLPRQLGVRRKLLPRFPYAIVFVESDASSRSCMAIAGPRSGGDACNLRQ